MIGVLVTAVVAVVAVQRLLPGCGDAVTELAADRSRSPFLDADGRADRPDTERDTLVDAMRRAPAPFGEVLGAVGYHYDQWAQLSAMDQGLGVRTRDDPDFTLLDGETLRPRWSVAVATKRSAYDSSRQRYLLTTLPAGSPPELVALDARTGRRIVCSVIGEVPVGPDDPFATAPLADNDVAVLTPDSDGLERLVRLDARDGSEDWQRVLDADSGDFLGELAPDKLLVGGRAQVDLFEEAAMAKRRSGPALTLVSALDGRTLWTRTEPAGSDVHVLGTDPPTGTAVILEWDGATRTARIEALDEDGNEVWDVVPEKDSFFDAAMRSGRILVRVGTRWSAYDIEDGRRLWTRVVAKTPQFLPYGFELDSVPLLDPEHVLVAGTTALHILDLRTGEMTSAALPTDGINTTYWPYQVAVTPSLIAVATNTGAVVLRRE